MGSLFRSQEMSLCQLYLQSEAAYTCISQFGELGLVQFRDLNTGVNPFQRKFVGEIQRCEVMERQLRYFRGELHKEDIEIYDPGTEPEAPDPRDMIDLEATYETHEGELKSLGSCLEMLESNYRSLKELKCVLQHAEGFFLESRLNIATDSSETLQGSERGIQLEPMAEGHRRLHHHVYLSFVAGVIESNRLSGFSRFLWFSCKGNAFLHHVDIPELSVVNVRMTVFIVFFQGEQLKEKVKKTCDGFRATMYPCPESKHRRSEMLVGLTKRIHEVNLVLQKTREQWLRVLESVAYNLHHWNTKVLKIKAIYHTMNMMSTEGSNYVAECWTPVSQIGSVQLLMNRATERSGTTAPSLLHPVYCKDLPTYHATTKFTSAFQQIIDSYGVASYHEVNPAPFSIITFPFLFSVMFGDAGHGFLLLLFGLFLVVRERHLLTVSQNNEIFGLLYSGRYIILLMGAFSVYSGLIYNDVFSKSLNIFGSSWSPPFNGSVVISARELQLCPSSSYSGSPYPFGFDPVWQLSKNKMMFSNSFKKKMSVIFGISQMLLGVCLSLVNHIHFRQWLNILCDFIPQMVFILVIFGYLCVCIFAKWILFTAEQSATAPNLLIGFINMFLMSYPEEPQSVRTWYTGQKTVQICFLLLAAFSAIWMVCAKPLILLLRYRRQFQYVLHVEAGNAEPDTASATDSGTVLSSDGSQTSQTAMLHNVSNTEQFEVGEVFIQQSIHAIEYCLGCVSHTASYLRLWALSLAHAELSEVLWTMIFRIGLTVPGPVGGIVIYMVFWPFALLTVTILLLMEGLSAFLHTLRLHWVEFQSKFYKGEGVPFVPFSFRTLLNSRTDLS